MAKRAEIKKWKDLALKELRGKPLESLDWNTAEGIPVKPMYTAADIEGMEHVKPEGPGRSDSMPVFLPPKSPTPFIAETWPPVRKVYQWLSTWRPIGDTTPIIRAWPVTSERPVWQWIPWRT
jgi:hypothetical protein